MDSALSVLKKVSLFDGIGENEIETMLKCFCARTTHYNKNESVLLEGDPAESIGIVLSGRVQILKDDFYGDRSIVASAAEGEIFAEAFACAGVQSLPVSVFASEESTVMFIAYRKLMTPCHEACAHHNRLIRNLLHTVARKNMVLNQKLEVLSKRTTKEKLIAYLSHEAKKAGKNRFEIPYNRQELADYLGVDRSAMSAELSKLRDAGVIEFQRSRFRLK